MPVDATQAAPSVASDAPWVASGRPVRIMSAIEAATTRPMIAEGMPVRGGAGAIAVPPGDWRGREIACGGAKAMPIAKTFG